MVQRKGFHDLIVSMLKEGRQGRVLSIPGGRVLLGGVEVGEWNQ